ncbi:MAG TPA: ABC transporter ATP-binding protein [Variovorax sp.]|nr:ABC transporter ATP-binding protein [Variovorax sp.]
MSTPVLAARGLCKVFNGFAAVSEVDLSVQAGAIHALIGPNGAGKSTIFNLLTKFLNPSAGRIFFKGEDITDDDPADIAQRGLVRSFQISSTFPHLSVLHNVRLALQRPQKVSFRFWRHERCLDSLDAPAQELLRRVGLEGALHMRAADLSYGRKRALELATTLALEPEVMLLDEPMAGLGREDIHRITELIRETARGRTVVMVEHNLKVVSALANTVTVLARGRVLAEGGYEEVAANPAVRSAYMGSAHA